MARPCIPSTGAAGDKFIIQACVNMAVQERFESSKPMCQQRDTARKVQKHADANVPASWKLSPQQKAFIDAFAEDEPKKQ
jgi:hypothetical protein